MIRTLLSLLPANRRRAVGAHLGLTVLGILLRAVGAVLLVPLVSALFGPRPAEAWPWLAALATATVLGWAVDAAAAKRGFALGFALLDSGQRTVADRIAEVRLAWFDAERTATARQAVAATGPDLVGVVIYLVTPVLSAILLPIAIAVALLPIAWPLALAALAGVPILFGAFWLAGRLSRDADRAAADANTALTERIVEFARTQQALRAARRVDPARSLAGSALAAQHRATTRLILLQVPGQLLFGLAAQLALLLLAGTTVWLAATDALSAPAAIALTLVIVRYLEPFTALAELAPGIEAATGALRNMRTVLEAPVDPAGEREPARGSAPRVALRGVSFDYDGATGSAASAGSRVLSDFDLELAPGTTTAIVGPSGSGKTTVLQLLAGLRRPGAGSVLVDGVPLAELSEASRRELVSVVFQHPYLFDGTVRDNILVGDPTASEDRWRAAAALARVDTLADRLPDGWESRVGEAGGSLSGGERQRVSIARALVSRAPVLLVDEATSALDVENEAAVAAALADDPTPRTRVIVAHRLSSIRAADRVVFLDGGRIVEDGSPEELLAAGGRFAEFWRQQHAASAWRLGAERSA
ncbi:ABC transporter ATP-binding protein [Leucobacter sp. OLTLW20]|uniref:ABC transporter ATP-binding protein n=1 Tax=Leucobacter sp. OLTLW20 TaxID=1914916 RepID=UPI000C182E50|nr:ABC transporter ATP-binding protein [Leucobacter sp. OLTLW20]PII86780.1 iron ABC transporter permease [Leucobacter sp. OLTLW20]